MGLPQMNLPAKWAFGRSTPERSGNRHGKTRWLSAPLLKVTNFSGLVRKTHSLAESDSVLASLGKMRQSYALNPG